jgi:hypothetical protein
MLFSSPFYGRALIYDADIDMFFFPFLACPDMCIIKAHYPIVTCELTLTILFYLYFNRREIKYLLTKS